jgi:probable addiction module antidote protein
MKKLKGTVSHRARVVEDLRADPKLARAYLLAAMEDDDPRVFLTALRNVAEARGMGRIAQAAGVRRESLYRTLSPTGNPRLSTLLAVLKATGLRLSLQRQKSLRDRAA